jgi:hypothetical protein
MPGQCLFVHLSDKAWAVDTANKETQDASSTHLGLRGMKPVLFFGEKFTFHTISP